MWFLVSLGFFLATVGLHLFVVRLPVQISNVLRFVAVGVILGGSLAITLLAVFGISSDAFGGLMFFAFACELYLFLFTLVISSVSVSILLRLRAGPINQDHLLAAYTSDQMVSMRLQRMTTNGLLAHAGDQYVLTAQGRSLVRSFILFRRLFGHERPSVSR